MFTINDEVLEALEPERDMANVEDRILTIRFLLLTMYQEEILNEEILPLGPREGSFSTVYPDFIKGRDLVFTTVISEAFEEPVIFANLAHSLTNICED